MNVHEHDVRLEAGNFRQRFLGRGAGKHAAKSRRGINPLAECFSHHGVVFNNGDGVHEGLLGTGSGSCRETVVPAPADESSSQRPFSFSSRLRRFARPCPFERPDGSKPLPLSLIEISSRSSSTRTRNPISVAPPWRTALLSASFAARKRWWRISPETT